jgi:O-antigen/teichoic acid export membrane protein
MFWSLLGAVVSRGVGVLSSIIVARILGLEAFGEFTTIQNTVLMFGFFAGLGLGVTATKYVAQLRAGAPDRCGQVLGLILSVTLIGGGATAVGFWAFAPLLAENLLGAARLEPLLRAGSTLVLFSALQGVYMGALQGFEAFKRIARANWVGGVLGTPLVVVGTFAGGLEGAVWGMALQTVVICIVCHLALVEEAAKAGVKISFGFDAGVGSILWRFTLPTFMSNVISGSANWACSVMLVRQPDGFNQSALLNVAGTWRNTLIFLPSIMGGVLTPMLSNLYTDGKKSEFAKLLAHNVWINAAIGLALAVPVCVLSPWILRAYGPGFINGMPVFVLSALMTSLVAVNNLLSRSMQASGRAWMDFSFNALWALVLVIGCVLMIPTHKAMGIAVSHAMAACALAIWQWLLIRRFVLGRTASTLEPDGTMVSS